MPAAGPAKPCTAARRSRERSEILDLRTGLATGVPLFSQVGVNAGAPPIPSDAGAPHPHEEVVHRDSPNPGIGRVRNTLRLVRDMCVNAARS
jgi:hypothetical protein